MVVVATSNANRRFIPSHPARYGKGRVMAFGHHDFLIDADAYDINSEHQRFMSNAVGFVP